MLEVFTKILYNNEAHVALVVEVVARYTTICATAKTHGSYMVTGSVDRYGPYSSMAHRRCAIYNLHMN